jgi:hypothetical protein
MFDAYKTHNRKIGAVEMPEMEGYLRTAILPSGLHTRFWNIVVLIW